MKPDISDPTGLVLPKEVVTTPTPAIASPLSMPAPLPSSASTAKPPEKTSVVTTEEFQKLRTEIDSLKAERQAEKDLVHAGKVQEASKLFQASTNKDEKVRKALLDKLQAMTTKDLETLMELAPTTTIKQGAGVAGIPGIVGVPLESTPQTGEGPRTVSLGRWNPVKKEWEDEK